MTERNPFDPRLVASLIAAGITAFILFFVLMAYAPEMRSGRDGRGHAMSVSAIGFHGIVEMLRLTGSRERLIRDQADLDTEDLVVVALEPRFDIRLAKEGTPAPDDRLASLIERRRGKATLVVLPKWSVMADPKKSGWVRSSGMHEPGLMEFLLRSVAKVKAHQGDTSSRVARGRDVMAGIDIPLPSEVQAISGDGIEPLLATPGGRSILARHGDGPLYILADPDLLNNQAMKDPARARAALAMLAALNSTGAETVAFDLTLNGFGKKPSALKLAFEPPFLALTVAIFVAALLAGLHGAFRFGPAAEEGRAIAFGKAALVANSAGLFRIAGREHRTGGAYAELVREEAARISGAPNLRGEELDAYLDRFSKPDEKPFSALAAEAGDAPDRNHLVSAARALFLWKKDLIQ
ncbi:MAG: hypothetical protein ACXW2T_02700 [Allosphingosinicella sp.]